MACYPVQCLVAPCPQVCDDGSIVGGTSVKSAPYVNITLPSRNYDAELLMYAAPNTSRLETTQPAYSGGQYPSSGQADFSITTESLDYWRIVLLALGIVIGAVIIKRL